MKIVQKNTMNSANYSLLVKTRQLLMRHQFTLSLVILFSVSFLLYSSSIFFDFVNYDDRSILVAHGNLYDGTSIIHSLKAILFDYFPREEPLIVRDISWLIDSVIFGFGNPVGYHLGNVAINAINVVLLFAFLNVTTQNFRFSFLVAFVFSLLPIHVEPICWIMGRKDLLSSFFMLCALYSQSLLLANAQQKYRLPLYVASIVFTLLSLLSKISAVPFFIVLGLHRIFWTSMRGEECQTERITFRYIYKTVVPCLLPHLAVSIIVFIWYHGVLNEWGMFSRGPGTFTIVHFKTLSVFIPLVLLTYAKLLVYPFQYSINYPLPSVSVPVELTELIFSFVFIAFLAVVGLFIRHRRRDLLFFYLSFFVLMIPYFNIVYIGIWVANRYLYFSVFCVVAIIVALGVDYFDHASRIMKTTLLSLAICLIGINALQSVLLQSVWRNDYSLWSYEAEYLQNPSLLSIQALAKYYVKKGEAADKVEEKRLYAEKADKLLQRGVQIFKQLGYVQTDYSTDEKFYYARFFQLKGRAETLAGKDLLVSLDYFEKSYEMNPGDSATLYFLFQTHKFLAKNSTNELSALHARKALALCARFISQKTVDMLWKSRILAELDDFEQNFDYLKSDIDVIRDKFLKRVSK